MGLLKQPATIENLPEDVLSNNIFILLLAKQLAQMRCVSKPWNDLLSQPSFVKSHLDHSIHHNDEIFLFSLDGIIHLDREPFEAYRSKATQHNLTNFIKPPINPPSKDVACFIVGCVNGLICFFNQPFHVCTVHIWNPSLSAVFALPPYTMASRGYDIIFGFGFNPKTNDYNVVKLTFTLRPPKVDNFVSDFHPTRHSIVKKWLRVEVYSMREGLWKIIDQNFPAHMTRINENNDEVFVDGQEGHLHWLCYLDEEQKLQTIVSFDLIAETFCEISLPKSFKEQGNDRVTLSILNGKLCVISSFRSVCEVWVMDAYGVARSWVKKHVFPNLGSLIIPYGFTSNKEFLFQSSSSLALYDPVAAKVKQIDIRTHRIGEAKVVHYVDSLVWIAPPKKDNIILHSKASGPKKSRMAQHKETGQEHVRRSTRLRKNTPKW